VNLGNPDLHRADAGPDLALGQMAVAHHCGFAILTLVASILRQQGLELGFNSLLDQLPGSASNQLGQRIGSPYSI